MKRPLKPRTAPVEFELEGSLGPLKARIKGLLTQSVLTPNQKIAARFVSLVVNHGILLEHIPRLFTGIRYSDLASLDTLADTLNPDILDTCASLFGVNVRWIEGGEGEIYPFRWCYQSPNFFQEHIVELGSRLADYPLRFLVDSDLKAGGKSPQYLALLILEKVTDLPGESELIRYHVYRDAWDWAHPPCRIQLKAMCRWLYLRKKLPIPIYRTSTPNVESVFRGELIPHDLVSGCVLTNPSMEDFCLSGSEYSGALEAEEMPWVFEYLQEEGLDPDGKIRKPDVLPFNGTGL